MSNTVNETYLDNLLLAFGFREVTSGTDMLRYAICYWCPGMTMMGDLYPMVAAKYGGTIQRVERVMRHAIETAWNRGDMDMVIRVFGSSIDPARGKPTVSEFVSRMARVCSNAH